MNTQRDILYRVLSKFPVSYLKHELAPDSDLTKRPLIHHILNTNTNDMIMQFIHDHFGMLKQHVYVLRLNNNLPQNWIPNNIAVVQELNQGNKRTIKINFSIETRSLSAINGTFENVLILIPGKIEIIGNLMIFYININDHKISDYLNGKHYLVNRGITEKDMIEQIKNSLPQGTGIVEEDLNRGVKFLWENDVIDALSSSYRASSSIDSITMDEDMLLKTSYPARYNDIILTPLTRLAFKYLEDDILIRKFEVKPDKGYLSFNLFSDSVTSTDEMVNLIISNN